MTQTWPQKHTSLRVRRERQGLTREQLAVQAGLASSTLYLAERTGVISQDVAAKVAPVLGCQATDLFKALHVFTVLDATETARKAGCKSGGGDDGDRIVVTPGVLGLVDSADIAKSDRMLGMVLRIVLEGPKAKRRAIAKGIELVQILGSGKGVEILGGKGFVLVRLPTALIVMNRPEWALNQAAGVEEIDFQIIEARPVDLPS